VRKFSGINGFARSLSGHDLCRLSFFLVDGKLVALVTPVEVLIKTNIKMAENIGVQIIPSPDN